MPDYSVLAENLNLYFVRGDEFALYVDADINLTGYTFEAKVYLPGVPPTSGGQTVTIPSVADGRLITAFAVEEVDLSQGKLNLKLTENQTNLFTNGATYRWYLRWVAPGDVTRTAISGALAATNP